MTTKTWPLRSGVHWRVLLSTGLATLAVLGVICGVWWLQRGEEPPEPDVKQALADALARAPAAPAAPAADSPTTAAEFEAYLQRHPKDVRALVLKARLDLREDRFAEAVAGFEKAIAASPKVARDPDVWVELAEAKGLQQGGKLSGPMADAIEKALALDPQHARALDLAGSLAWERGDFAAAARHWSLLLARLAPTDPRHAELSAAIEAAGRRARFALPAAPGSTASPSSSSPLAPPATPAASR